MEKKRRKKRRQQRTPKTKKGFSFLDPFYVKDSERKREKPTVIVGQHLN